MSPGALVRLQGAGALALGLGVALALGHAATVDPDAAFLSRGGPGVWIGAPRALSTGAHAAPLDALPEVEFRKVFRADAGARGGLEVWGLRGFELSLNGMALAARPWHEEGWREPVEVVLDDALVEGENVLRLRAKNPRGPPLVRVRGGAGGVDLATDASWRVRSEAGALEPARVADDTRRPDAAGDAPPVWPRIRAHGALWLGLLALACALAFALGRPFAAGFRARLPVALGAGVALLWLVVFATAAIRLPAYMGFDGPYHLEYVQYLLARRALPLAHEGFQMYQPPLFYALSAGLVAALSPLSVPMAAALRVLPLGCGLAQAGLAFALGRRLFPGDAARPLAAGVAAGLLPVNVYVSSYLSNEPLHGALAGAATVLTAGLLVAPAVSMRGALLAGAVLGLAILSKATSLVLVPLVVGFLAMKAWAVDGVRPLRALRPAGLAAVAVAAVAGWFFLRNQLRLGRAVIGNWELPGLDLAWWQDPGFHTVSYYVGFGGVLHRPFFAGFVSFWDGLYATFWGDGLLGGVSAWAQRHPFWDYDAMAAVYWLALPATGLLLFGLGRFARDAFGDPDPRRRAALLFVVATVLVTLSALVWASMVHPGYSMAKASYLLSVAAPLSLALADGFLRLRAWLRDAGWAAARVALDAWAALLVAGIALTYAG